MTWLVVLLSVFAGWLAGWLVGWLAGSLADQLAGWNMCYPVVVHCMIPTSLSDNLFGVPVNMQSVLKYF